MSGKADDVIYASLQPTEAKFLTSQSHTLLLLENPILASALFNIFPYLLLIDSALEVVTWTNENPYSNFLFIVLYSVLVVWWHSVKLVVLPLLFALAFLCLIWTVNSVIYDSRFNEKPTIDEVLQTLHNIVVRIEMLLRPAQHVSIRGRNLFNMFVVSALLTPVHVAVVKTVIPPQKFVWLVGLFALSYHLPWLYSVRRLLWRSVYVRIFAFYLTGLDIKLDRRSRKQQFTSKNISRINTPSTSDVEDGPLAHSSRLLADFKIVRKSIVSPTQLKQTVLFEVLENERRWLGLGWSKFLLPGERAKFCFRKSLKPAPAVLEPAPELDREFPFPLFESDLHTYLWLWLDDEWTVDHEFSKGKSSDAWVYYDSNWDNESYTDGFSRYTRARKWVRRATLLIDKQHVVYDE